MTEEEKKEIIEEKEDPVAQEKDKLEKMNEMLSKLEEKEKMLIDREQILDKKIKEFDGKAAKLSLEGFSSARIEQTEEEKAIKAAKNLIRGTGLEEYAFPTKR